MALGSQQPVTITGTATADEKRAALVASMQAEYAAVASMEYDDEKAKARQKRRLAHIGDVLAKYGETPAGEKPAKGK